jgi:hypothetical protein
MSAFKDWWNGPNSPARRLPQTTADQVEWVAKAAFEAGTQCEHELWKAKQEPRGEAFKF